MAGPSRASQIGGPPVGIVRIARYCQSQRRRLASAMSLPNTRRYRASTAGRSSAVKLIDHGHERTSGPGEAAEPVYLTRAGGRSTTSPGAVRFLQHVFDVADDHVLSERTVADPARRSAPAAAGTSTSRAGTRGRRRSPATAIWPRRRFTRTSSSRSSCLMRFRACQLDERVLVGRLAQRPRRMSGEQHEDAERQTASEQQVQRDRHLQPRQMRAGKRQVGRGREIQPAAGPQDARAFAR